jgi:hypothetical protein
MRTDSLKRTFALVAGVVLAACLALALATGL